MSSQNLKSFLAGVATDSQKLKAFKSEPESAMKSAGLPDEHIKAVLSGDPQEIANQVGPIVAGDTIIILIL
jgi:hypothetical protein